MPHSREQDISRLDIPVNNSSLMRVFQRPSDLQSNLDHAFKLALVEHQPGIEIAMFSIWHDKEAIVIASIFLHPRVDQLDNVIVVEAAQNVDFVSKPRNPAFPFQPLQPEPARQLAAFILDVKD